MPFRIPCGYWQLHIATEDSTAENIRKYVIWLEKELKIARVALRETDKTAKPQQAKEKSK